MPKFLFYLCIIKKLKQINGKKNPRFSIKLKKKANNS